MEHVTHVLIRDGYRLDITFDTGERRIFDATPYLQMGVFEKLKDPDLFRQAYVAYGTVCWPGDLDIAPETLYDRSVAVEAQDVSTGDQDD